MITHFSEGLLRQFYQGKPWGKTEAFAVHFALFALLKGPYFLGQHDAWVFVEPHDSDCFLQYPNGRNTKEWRVVPYEDIDQKSVLDKEKGMRLAQQYIKNLDQAMVQKALHPTPDDLKEKFDIQYRQVNAPDLADVLRSFLGDTFHASLKPNGHVYHHHPSFNNNDWMFVVGHNKDEVAGILGFYPNTYDDNLVLSYVSVAPGFRNRGIGKKMLCFVSEEARSQKKLLVRSTASELSQEIGASKSYSRFFDEQGILHVGTDTKAHASLIRALKKVPYDILLEQSRGKNWGYQGCDIDEEHEQRVALEIEKVVDNYTTNQKPQAFGAGQSALGCRV